MMLKKKKPIKKESSNDSDIIPGKPLTFFHTTTKKMVEKRESSQGIQHYCCKDMKKACKSDLKDDNRPYNGGIQSLILNQEYYEDKNKPKNGHGYNSRNLKIGCHTHKEIREYSEGEYEINWKDFNFCPWCGTNINGTIKTEVDKR